MTISEKATIGERIKQERKKNGLTQKELAEKIGVSYQMVQAWENNRRNPKRETLQKIASALGIAPSILTEQRIVRCDDGTTFIVADDISDIAIKQLCNDTDSKRQSLLEYYDNLNISGKNVLLNFAKNISTTQGWTKNDNVVSFISNDDGQNIEANLAEEEKEEITKFLIDGFQKTIEEISKEASNKK